MRNDDDAALLWMVQTGPNLVVEEFIDTFETLDIVAVFDFCRIVDDDEIGAQTGYPALNRERANASAGGDSNG